MNNLSYPYVTKYHQCNGEKKEIAVYIYQYHYCIVIAKNFSDDYILFIYFIADAFNKWDDARDINLLKNQTKFQLEISSLQKNHPFKNHKYL